MESPKIPYFKLPKESVNLSQINPRIFEALKPAALAISESNFASEFYEKLARYIIDFEKELDPEHEVGARLVNFGVEMVIHVDGISYKNPSLICFHGRGELGPVQLIQHVSQINFLLTVVPRENKERERIGFKLAAELNKKSDPKI